jgi:hypothetical protein
MGSVLQTDLPKPIRNKGSANKFINSKIIERHDELRRVWEYETITRRTVKEKKRKRGIKMSL